jgi:ArsR family transcriptional regulator, arsenate/arsenite/antimonite-responsive transcriptional repressor
MDFHKQSFESNQLNELAHWCKALGHPARLMIVQTLMKQSQCMCGDLTELIPLSQATISQHLKALKEAGLIKGELQGPRSRYCLDTKKFKKLLKNFESLKEDFDESCC